MRIKEDDRENLLARASEIGKIELELDKEKPHLINPIYDVNGNLLWPKQMSYEEVKTFVSEKDKQNTNDASPGSANEQIPDEQS